MFVRPNNNAQSQQQAMTRRGGALRVRSSLQDHSLMHLGLLVIYRWYQDEKMDCSLFSSLRGACVPHCFSCPCPAFATIYMPTSFASHGIPNVSPSSIPFHCRPRSQDVTNTNNSENHQGSKPGQKFLPLKRDARSDAYPLPSARQPNGYQGHQSIILEQRNPMEELDAHPQMHRSVTETNAPRVAHNEFSNPSSYQFGQPDDIDERDAVDPLCTTDYVQDMYEHFRSKESATSVRPLYMETQTHINERMRSILVDWLVEVHLKFKLVPETLYLTINLIDRYLERQEVSRPKLQLVGVTSLLIASKYEEIYPPELRDLVYICDRAYTRTEVRSFMHLFLFLFILFMMSHFIVFNTICLYFRSLRWRKRF